MKYETQSRIESVLDRWTTSAQLEWIKANYNGFFNNPERYRDIREMIIEDMKEVFCV